MFPRKLFIAASLFALVLPPRAALALDEIYSPHAEEGELSIGYNFSRTFDKDPAKDDAQSHSVSVEYGVNSWFTAEFSGGFAQEPGDIMKFEDLEIEGRAQFFEPGEAWVDSGLLLAYGFSTLAHEPDALEAKLLLEKDFGRITTTANVGFEQAVGTDAPTGGQEYVLLANSRYRSSEEFQPGIELQSAFGQMNDVGMINRQEHYFGPALYGRLFGHLKYQAAWLFGLTDASSESAARILLEYEMHF